VRQLSRRGASSHCANSPVLRPRGMEIVLPIVLLVCVVVLIGVAVALIMGWL
jgi:hypothetical protein